MKTKMELIRFFNDGMGKGFAFNGPWGVEGPISEKFAEALAEKLIKDGFVEIYEPREPISFQWCIQCQMVIAPIALHNNPKHEVITMKER